MPAKDYETLLDESSLPLRIKKELKSKSVELSFEDTEFISVSDKSGSNGLLIFSEVVYSGAVAYSMRKNQAATNGKMKPMTCDFCMTWLPGGKVGQITLRDAHARNITHTFYCCSKLNCSLNVRDASPEALESRSQIRENVDQAGRIVRLQNKLTHYLQVAGYIS